MTPEQLDNWKKIKTHLETVGATENDYYTGLAPFAPGVKTLSRSRSQ